MEFRSAIHWIRFSSALKRRGKSAISTGVAIIRKNEIQWIVWATNLASKLTVYTPSPPLYSLHLSFMSYSFHWILDTNLFLCLSVRFSLSLARSLFILFSRFNHCNMRLKWPRSGKNSASGNASDFPRENIFIAFLFFFSLVPSDFAWENFFLWPNILSLIY